MPRIAGLLACALILGCSAADSEGDVADAPEKVLRAAADVLLERVPEGKSPRLNVLYLPERDSVAIEAEIVEHLRSHGVEPWRWNTGGARDASIAVLSFAQPQAVADGSYEVEADWFVQMEPGAYSRDYLLRVRCGEDACRVEEVRLGWSDYQ